MSKDQPTPRRIVWRLMFLLAAFAIVWSVAWYRVRDRVTTRPDYYLRAEQIEITPPPLWIHSDIKSEALRDASLDRPLSILDDDLTKRIYEAFPLHPWVKSVTRVSKHYPARVRVELVYRRPVCMVEVPGGLFAVDEQSVLLPSGDFSPSQAAKYPRLAGIESVPIGQVGGAWGDARVAGACRLAAVLLDDWSSLGLDHIRVDGAPVGESESETFNYQLQFSDGRKALWGLPPRENPGQDATAAKKLAQLKEEAAQQRASGDASRKEIDLRRFDQPAARTAAQAPGKPTS